MLVDDELEYALVLIHWKECTETGIDIDFEVWSSRLTKEEIEYIKENNNEKIYSLF